MFNAGKIALGGTISCTMCNIVSATDALYKVVAGVSLFGFLFKTHCIVLTHVLLFLNKENACKLTCHWNDIVRTDF